MEHDCPRQGILEGCGHEFHQYPSDSDANECADCAGYHTEKSAFLYEQNAQISTVHSDGSCHAHLGLAFVGQHDEDVHDE